MKGERVRRGAWSVERGACRMEFDPNDRRRKELDLNLGAGLVGR